MRKTDLTQYQLDALHRIQELLKAHPYPPTVTEIAEKLGIARKTAYERMLVLRKKKYIDWLDGKPRTVQVIKKYKIETHANRY